MELLFELRDLGERTLETAVFEQHARVIRERLQERDILPGERADVADPVADQQDAEGPLLAREAAHDRIAEPAGAEERVERVTRAPTREQDRLWRRCDRADRALVDGADASRVASAVRRLVRSHSEALPHPRRARAGGSPRSRPGAADGPRRAARPPRGRTPGHPASRASTRRGTRPARAAHAGSCRRGTRRRRRSPAAPATRAPPGRAPAARRPAAPGSRRTGRRSSRRRAPGRAARPRTDPRRPRSPP